MSPEGIPIHGSTRFREAACFPVSYSKADFKVLVSGDRYSVIIENKENELIMSITAEIATELPRGSVFASTGEISDFFKTGNVGWSSRGTSDRYDAIELTTEEWRMEPLRMNESYSAYFSDTSVFPVGSVEFDSAVIMRNIKHSWVSRNNLLDL